MVVLFKQMLQNKNRDNKAHVTKPLKMLAQNKSGSQIKNKKSLKSFCWK